MSRRYGRPDARRGRRTGDPGMTAATATVPA